jgi:hypothetical protein
LSIYSFGASGNLKNCETQNYFELFGRNDQENDVEKFLHDALAFLFN